MRLILFSALFCIVVLPSGNAEDYNAAQANIDAIEAMIREKREDILSSGSQYERLQNQRSLEQSEQALRDARRTLDEIKKSLQPGTKEWDQELLIKDGREFRSIPGREKDKDKEDEYKYGVGAPDVGPGAAMDPRVHQHSWVGEPGSGPRGPLKPIEIPKVPTGQPAMNGVDRVHPGEILYGRPAGFRNSHRGPIQDPRERKRRHAESVSELKNAPIPPSTGSALGAVPDVDDGGPILNPNGFGDTGRSFPKLAPNGFTFDGPEGEMLKQFPELEIRERGVRGEGITLIRDAGRRLRLGDTGGALRSADRLAQISPKDPGVHEMRALILNRLGRFVEAESAARLSLTLDDSRGSAWRTLAWAQFKQGKAAAALRSAERALVLDPQDASALALRAYALERLGQRKQALQSIQQAAKILPASFAAAAARAAGGAPVSPSPAPSPPPAKKFDLPLWVGGVAAGGLLLGVGWFAFKTK
ncbi:MAG: hypothetical protein COB53_02365 [Elusimicrobia bacterium]|nr:MAG: hypothetical protein COB53_02365 [Elusimicrobiota bacterium]